MLFAIDAGNTNITIGLFDGEELKKTFRMTTGIARTSDEYGVFLWTGINIALPNPKQLGADRIVDAVAAYHMYGGPVLTVDFGTATTYDLINEDGVFEAEVTSPGIRLIANALWTGTAKLPEIEIKVPETILCKDTISSMQAGVCMGYIGQTEYIVRRMKKESGLDNIKVVATGGLGKMIYENTDCIDVYDPDLTLHGLRLIMDKQK